MIRGSQYLPAPLRVCMPPQKMRAVPDYGWSYRFASPCECSQVTPRSPLLPLDFRIPHVCIALLTCVITHTVTPLACMPAPYMYALH